MDSRQDCVFLVSNEHEMFFVVTDHKSNKKHVHSFGSVLYNCVSDDAVGDNVVKFNWCWTLDVVHLMQGIKKGNSIFDVDETLASFRFLNRGHDSVNYFSVDKNWCIDFWWRIIWFDWEFAFVRKLEETTAAREIF